MTPLLAETEFKGVGPEDRKCLYSDEADLIPREDFGHLVEDIPEKFKIRRKPPPTRRALNLLQNYSQAGCVFQCKLQAAATMAGHTTAGACLPWYYPAKFRYPGKINEPTSPNTYTRAELEH